MAVSPSASVNFLGVEIMGELFIDEEFGHHYIPGSSKLVSDELREEIAKRIRAALAAS